MDFKDISEKNVIMNNLHLKSVWADSLEENAKNYIIKQNGFHQVTNDLLATASLVSSARGETC